MTGRSRFKTRIPPSSDDDRDSLQNEILSYSESVTRPPRRHGRICVPMSFSGIRKQMGKKRFRRYENGNTTFSIPDQNSNTNIPVTSNPVYCKSNALDHSTTDADSTQF
uniref:Uncharacterized protein n=1 Tax=Timema genevievae TaxID=629358 RepID=A0A7R9PRS8_TIMGE|nr:unnamed protein product [Timema genevievae]